MQNIYLQILPELEKNNALGLVTLLKTEGSTPQIAGASALFNSKGLVCGTIGGGILENEAKILAKKAIHEKKSHLGSFNFNANIQDDRGAICGGKARFLIDANPKDNVLAFQRMKYSLQQKNVGFLITWMRIIEDELLEVKRFWIEKNQELSIDLSENLKTNKEVLKYLLQTQTNHLLECEDGVVCMFEFIDIPAQLIIAGAGHVGQALCYHAHMLGFEVSILDDRPELATKDRFPEASRILRMPIVKGMEGIEISKNTYIVIVTQGHREDSEVLKSCIKSEAGYIGMIGSQRKIGLMKEQFLQEKWATEEEWNRIYAPVGLNIHAESIHEIAVSIAAQLVQIRRSKKSDKPKRSVMSVVLAAGKSTRMNQQKLLMPWKGKTIIEHVVKTIQSSTTEEVVVVLGSHHEKIMKTLRYLHPIFAENEDYEAGMLSSIQIGIKNLPEHAQAVLIQLGDQPMIHTETINRLIEVFQTGSKGIVLPSYNGKRGHPLLIDLKYRNEIDHLNPKKGLRELLYKYPQDIEEVEVDTSTILTDIDTPDDYRREHLKSELNQLKTL